MGVGKIDVLVVEADASLHVFTGPGDFNGYGYFPVRLYWTGLGLPVNTLGEYRALLTSQALTVRWWCSAGHRRGQALTAHRRGQALTAHWLGRAIPMGGRCPSLGSNR